MVSPSIQKVGRGARSPSHPVIDDHERSRRWYTIASGWDDNVTELLLNSAVIRQHTIHGGGGGH